MPTSFNNNNTSSFLRNTKALSPTASSTTQTSSTSSSLRNSYSRPPPKSTTSARRLNNKSNNMVTTTTTTTTATATATPKRTSPNRSALKRNNNNKPNTNTTSPSKKKRQNQQNKRMITTPPSPSPSRRGSGLLSERTMSQIRCPSRVDFLNAINGVAPSTLSFGSAKALARSRSRFVNNNNSSNVSSPITSPSPMNEHNPSTTTLRTPPVTLRTSRLTDEEEIVAQQQLQQQPSNNHVTPPTSPQSPIHSNNIVHDTTTLTSTSSTQSPSFPSNSTPTQQQSDDTDNNANNANSNNNLDDDTDDDYGVPAYLNKLVLDAMDRISECDELRAVVTWMDLVRAQHGFTSCITDIDLTNGIALLQTLTAVAPQAFDSVSHELAIVRTHLDEHGHAAKENITNVCKALHRFPWRDGAEGKRLKSVDFERVDEWGLAGFVVVAAVVGNRADMEVDRMLKMEEWVQEKLYDVVYSGLEALGGNAHHHQQQQQQQQQHHHQHDDNDDHDEIEHDDSDNDRKKRKRNEDLQFEVSELIKIVQELKLERDELQEKLQVEKEASNQVRAELKKLKALQRQQKYPKHYHPSVIATQRKRIASTDSQKKTSGLNNNDIVAVEGTTPTHKTGGSGRSFNQQERAAGAVTASRRRKPLLHNKVSD